MSRPEESVRSRIRAFLEEGDAAALTDEAAQQEVDALWRLANAVTKETPRQMLLLASFYLYRYVASPRPLRSDLDRAGTMMADLDEFVPGIVPESFRRTLSSVSQGSTQSIDAQLVDIAAILQTHHQRPDVELLNLGISQLRNGIVEIHKADPRRVQWIGLLAASLSSRFEETGDPSDLDETISLAEEALREARAGLVDHVATQLLYATALRNRATSNRRRDSDLGEAIKTCREAIELAGDHHPARTELWVALGNCLRDRFDQSRNVPDLHEAVEVALLAVGSNSETKPGHSNRLSIASAVLSLRFKHLGQVVDLEEAVELGRAALDASEAGWKDEVATRGNLASLLTVRYERLGRLADLDEAIELLSQKAHGVRSTPDQRAGVCDALASAQLRRFEASDKPDLSLLDLAIKNAQEAVNIVPMEHPNRPAFLSNLATILRTRVSLLRLTTPKSAEEVRRSWQVASTESKHQFLSTVGKLLRQAFSGDIEDDELRRIVEIAKSVVTMTPIQHADRPIALISLANAYFARFNRTPNMSDLDLAIKFASEASEAAPHDQPLRAGMLLDLGKAREMRFVLTDDRSYAFSAINVYREAAEAQGASVEHRLSAAYAWATLAASIGEWSDSVEGYARAVALLDRLAWRGLEGADQRRVLRAWSGLGGEAAACSIAADQPGRAISLIEQGRAVVWSQALDSMSNERLNERAPVLASDLAQLETRLSQLARNVSSSDADTRMRLARKRDVLVARIRKLDGFEDFQRAPSVSTLTAASEEGPVVLLVDSIHGSSAIIVDESVRVVPIDWGASGGHSLRVQIDAYVDAQKEFAGLSQAWPGSGTEEAIQRWRTQMAANQSRISEVLEWMWDVIANPVLDVLGLSTIASADLSRIWWCPTGRLALLPIHAAGYHKEGLGRTVFDRAISSYTPTLRALEHSRRKAFKTSHCPEVLVVAQQRTSGLSSLPMVEQEVGYLRSTFGGAVALLTEANATIATVTRGLERYGAVHFACHGHQDVDDPSRSGVSLHDGRLTIADVGRYVGRHAELAFLSSCDTATVDADSPDEVITLAAALQYAGYRHVVGALGPVVDRSASQIAVRVYSGLTGEYGLDPKDAATALHEAVVMSRDEAPNMPSAWSTIIHAGP